MRDSEHIGAMLAVAGTLAVVVGIHQGLVHVAPSYEGTITSGWGGELNHEEVLLAGVSALGVAGSVVCTGVSSVSDVRCSRPAVSTARTTTVVSPLAAATRRGWSRCSVGRRVMMATCRVLGPSTSRPGAGASVGSSRWYRDSPQRRVSRQRRLLGGTAVEIGGPCVGNGSWIQLKVGVCLTRALVSAMVGLNRI